ncbi:MAG: pilus assembly protein PilM [Planctomycetes bacterium]|nr:pilus assembly protein PilM [Planctomycetota bacterium]
MARTCGIRVGPRRYEMVVLDGSAKKHRIAAYKSGEFPQGGEDPMADAVRELESTIKELKVPVDAVGVAIDSGLAAFRTLKLPALDESKINDIIKFEVESQLPQWNIDDVVVDFMTLDKTEQETQLLVTAVPKSALQRELDLCSRAGVEPLDAELEATAMVNAALAAEVCAVDEAQVLVHIGEASTAVVVLDGGKVRSMRAIHIGALTHDPGAGPEALAEGATEDAEQARKRAAAVTANSDEAARRLEQAVSRIRRELGRTLSAARTANPIKAVYVCGWELPNLIGSTVLDIPVYELDAFVEDSGQPVQGAAPLVIAYGVALRMLGGGSLRPSLRREELRYTGTFERLELPIAVAVMLLVMWLSVFNIFEHRRIQNADGNLFLWLQSNKNFLINDPKAGKRGHLEKPWKEIQELVEKTAKPDSNLPWPRLDQFKQIERELQVKIAKLNQELGNTGEVAQPQSALEALTLVCCKMDDLKDQLGRVSIRRVNANYVPKTGGQDFVQVQLDLSFFNAGGAVAATGAFEALKSGLESSPWVREVVAKTTKEFPDGGGIYTDGFVVVCDLSKVERAKEGS